MFYLYILYSASSDKYYVGYTSNFIRRLEEHNTTERNTFTSKHRPWILKGVYACGTNESDAINIERFIKKQKSRQIIKYILDDGILSGILAQLVRVPHVRD